MEIALSPNEINRVRRNTSPSDLAHIDAQTARNIRFYAAQPHQVISRRIEELEREWSVERCIEVNSATIGFTTSVLGLTVSRKWGLVTCMALGFFLLHALQGFDPPLPLLRKLGIRTRGEIDRELYALKALRGDFPQPTMKGSSNGAHERAAAALRAVMEP